MSKKYDHIKDIESMRALVLKRDKIIAEREQDTCVKEKALLNASIKELEDFKEKYITLREETIKLLEDIPDE